MKKAQWKKDPRERVFGKDPRETLNDELTAALKKANDTIQQQTRRVEWLNEHLEKKQEQLRKLYEFRNAYMKLRHMGVVLADAEEFKHLQGEDMDAFCGLDLRPKTPTEVRAMVERETNSQFEKALQQWMLYGTSAPTKIFHDELQVYPWHPHQKQK